VKRNLQALSLAALVAWGLLGCSLTDTLLSNVVGGSKGNTVASLWSDVPPPQGGQKVALDLPVTVQLAIQGMIKASASSSDVSLDSFDWIAFSTSQTPEQVAAYYNMDRMKAAGWNLQDQPGCSASADSSSGGGGFCMFGKGQGTANQKGALLFIVLGQDDKTKQTQVFYVRLEGIVNKTPTK
jgi:hypothetical protein